jgi:hypothetical protein
VPWCFIDVLEYHAQLEFHPCEFLYGLRRLDWRSAELRESIDRTAERFATCA